jgi:hypothetical protein
MTTENVANTSSRHAQERVEGGEITAHDFAISRLDPPEV